MPDVRGAVVLGQPVAEQPRRAVRDSARVAERGRQDRLAGMVTASGARLFPEVPVPPAWAEDPPGSALLATVESLHPAELGEYDLVEVVRACERLAAFVQARQIRALAALAARPMFGSCAGTRRGDRHAHDPVRAAADEVSCATGWTPSYADARVREAVTLVEQLPATLAVLEGGRIDAYRARVIGEELGSLADHPQLRARVEREVLTVAPGKTGPQLRALVKRRVLAAAPELAEQRRAAARRHRRVDKPYPTADGMAQMSITRPVEGLAALWLAVDAAARARRATNRAASPGPGPDGSSSSSSSGGRLTLDEHRFDVLADLGWSALSANHLGCCNQACPGSSAKLGARHGRAAQVQLTVPFTTIAGLSDLPGELHGFGTVTAEVARRIAADGTWRRILTDPATGALLDYGTTRYEPPQHLVDHIVARDRTCRFTTCQVAGPSLRHRPHHPGGPRRTDQRHEHRPTAPPPSQQQNPARLATPPTPLRPLPVDHTHPSPVRSRARNHRNNHRDRRIATHRTHTHRPRPASILTLDWCWREAFPFGSTGSFTGGTLCHRRPLPLPCRGGCCDRTTKPTWYQDLRASDADRACHQLGRRRGRDKSGFSC